MRGLGPIPLRLPMAAFACAAAVVLAGAVLGGETGGKPAPGAAPAAFASPAALGEALFFDVSLSKNRTQSCATCHDPSAAFADPRPSPAKGAVSLGDDGKSFGRRNAPGITYLADIPAFHRDAEGYRGGLFHDGRAPTLPIQAVLPVLDPREMGMPDKAGVVARLRENPTYVAAFDTLFAPGVLNDPEAGFAALGQSLAAFERTDLFAPYDSRYDRWLRGEIQLTPQEELGRVLFFSKQFTNCSRCHLGEGGPSGRSETFTNHRFHNIGVPANRAVTALAGAPKTGPDAGLGETRDAAGDPAQKGRFRTPGLRNVAVTGPYMHNGVFKDLRTVVLFYNSYNTRSEKRRINPETGRPFPTPEFPDTLSREDLEFGPALDDKRVDALVAFLKTLTDKRYEHLLAK